MRDNICELILRLGDNTLILAQQNAKWCGHGPTQEEDIALANVALDLLGHARLWLQLAGQRYGRSEDDLAYFRDPHDFRCAHLVQHPNGDYGQTLVRQYLFDSWHLIRIQDLCTSSDSEIAEIAAKAAPEVTYHLRRSRHLVLTLAHGTSESHHKIQAALERLWFPFGSLFEDAPGDQELAAMGVARLPSSFQQEIAGQIRSETRAAGLKPPESDQGQMGAIRGYHSEHLGHILTEMQTLQRNYPGLEW